MTLVEGITVLIAVLGLGAAIHGQVLGRRALTWQQQRDQERSTPDVQIEFQHAVRARPGVTWPNGHAVEPGPLHYEVDISISNRGETTEFVKSVWVFAAARDRGLDLAEQLGGDRELKPHARIVLNLGTSDLPEWPDGFVGIARLARCAADGSPVDIVSSVERLMAEFLDDISRDSWRSSS